MCVCTCTQCENVCVGAASHRPRMLVGPVWCQRSVLSGRHSGLSAWRQCAWVDCCLYSTSLSHMCLLPTDLWRTHTHIYFRKHGFENKNINSQVLLYKLHHEGLISLKMTLSLSALLCTSLRVIAKAIMEGNKHRRLTVKYNKTFKGTVHPKKNTVIVHSTSRNSKPV